MAFFVDDKKIGGVSDLCKLLKLDEKEIPYKKRLKEFEQLMDRDVHGNPRRDQDGNYRTKRKIAGTPQFRIYVPKLGYDVRVRIAQTQDKVEKAWVYTPKLISMDPAEDGSCPVNDEIEFAFWFLHPWCLSSPYHVKGGPAFYEYKDNEGQSKRENDYEEDKINALGYIIGQHAKSIKELRAIAKGLNVTGVDDMTDEVVKKTLRQIASSNPVDFVNKIDSRETAFSGTVQDAIDKGILNVKDLNGMRRWYLNEKEILPIPYGTDEVAILKEELSTKYYLYAKDLQNALDNVTVASNLASVENDEAFEGIQSHKIQQRAELTSEQLGVLKKMEQEQWYDEKIKKLAAIDPTDMSVHHATRASYESNKAAVELYKQTLLAETELA